MKNKNSYLLAYKKFQSLIAHWNDNDLCMPHISFMINFLIFQNHYCGIRHTSTEEDYRKLTCVYQTLTYYFNLEKEKKTRDIHKTVSSILLKWFNLYYSNPKIENHHLLFDLNYCNEADLYSYFNNIEISRLEMINFVFQPKDINDLPW